MAEFTGESVALVTGAATGIGYATAKLLLEAGITKLAILDFNPTTLPTATTTLQTLFPKSTILSLLVNVSSESEVTTAFHQIISKFNRLDLCVNNAAIGGGASLMESQTMKNWDDVIGTNAKGVWLCEREEIKQMMKQDVRPLSTNLPHLTTRGAIVNIGSLAGQAAIHQMNAYVMSKHALAGLTKADAIDYAQLGIRVNCVQPGPVKTPFMQLYHEGELKHLGDRAIARAPMNRWADPEEIAHTILFLLSDKASFVTGAVWNVDGGYGAM